jgi:hypothetical protein
MEISVEEFEGLISQLEEAKKEKEALYNIALNIMKLMGLIDPATNKLKADIASGEESFFPNILQALREVVALLLKAQMPKWAGGESAEKEIQEKFYFIKELMPLIEKYGK